MALSGSYSSNGEQEDDSQVEKRYRFELSLRQVILYGLGAAIAMSWMFVFGVLIGRGVPLVSSEDLSPKAHLYRFLGLGRETPPPPEDVARTWEDPKKMMEALKYYEDLTQKGSGGSPLPHVPPSPLPAPLRAGVESASAAVTAQKKAAEEQKKLAEEQRRAAEEAAALAQKQAAEEAAAASQRKTAEEASATAQKKSGEDPAAQKAKQSAASTPASMNAQPPAPVPQKSAAKKPQPDPVASADGPFEHFTLLIASLKDSDSAQRLVEQLRAKGHAARIEALDLNDSGRWNRVLVGAFRNREEALRFAAEFNRKEHMEALVIREARSN